MRRRTWVWIGVYVAATAVLAAGVVMLVRDGRGETTGERASAVDALPDLAPMPFPATLSLTGSSNTAIGSQVQLSAASYSEAGAATIELWDGARRVATVEPSGGGSSAELLYPALSAGPHALYVQVTDRDGKTSQSAVVEVNVAPVATGRPQPVPVQADEGETPDELATRLGVEPEHVLATAPGAVSPAPGETTGAIDGSSPIGPDDHVVVIVEGDEGIESAAGDEAVVTSPTPADGGSLTLTAEADVCDVVLRSTGSDGAVFYFDANAGVPGWASVGETDGDGELRLVALEPGVHVYKARTDALTAPPVSVVVPAACADGTGWRGTASIVDGSLVLPEEAVGPVWLYLSVDGRPAVRAPLSQDETISAGRITPVAYALPPLSGKRLLLEVWKPTGTDMAPVVPVAKGTLDVPPGKTMTDIVGEPSGIALSVSEPTDPAGSYKKLGDQDTPLNFTWAASSDRVTEVMWQVTTSPHPTSDRDLVPADLIAAGTSTMSSAAGPGTTGTFTIDSVDIPGRSATGAQAIYQDSLKPKAALVTPPTTAAKVIGLTEPTFAATIDESKVTEEVLAIAQVVDLPSFGDPVYVRVVAKPQGPAVGAGSTTVRIDLPVPQGQNGSAIDFRRSDPTNFDPGRRPNLSLTACVVVTVPWNGSGLTYSLDGGKTQTPYDPSATPPPGGWTLETRYMSAFYPRSGTYCPSDFPRPAECDDVLCSLWEGVVEVAETVIDGLKQAYSVVASTWNGIIGFAIDAAAELGLCEVAGEVSGGDDTTAGCQQVLRTVTSIAITVVLAYYGLPARLPTVEELEGVARGELTAAAVGLMEYYGVPCDELKTDPEALAALAEAAGEDPEIGRAAGDPCTALAAYLLAQIEAQVEAALETGVAAATGLPSVASIPGATMQLDPRGQRSPARLDLTMEVAKSNADASGVSCLVKVQPRVPFGFDDDGKQRYHLPIRAELVQLTEVAPIDGTGRWQGSVTLADTVPVEGKRRDVPSMEALVTSTPGSRCAFEPFVVGPTELRTALPR